MNSNFWTIYCHIITGTLILRKKTNSVHFFLNLKVDFFHFFGRRTERLDDEVQAKQEEEQIG